jgi:hypothetical protein
VGLLSVNTANTVSTTVVKSYFEDNLDGIKASDFSNMTVRDSDASGNTFGFLALANAGTGVLSLTNSVASNNSTAGIYVQNAGSSVRMTGVSLFDNAVGLSINAGATVSSAGNNVNTNGGAPNGPGLTVQ